MKKILIGLSGLIILAFVVILVVSARSIDTKTKDSCCSAATEAQTVHASSCCSEAQVSQKAACDPAQCGMHTTAK